MPLPARLFYGIGGLWFIVVSFPNIVDAPRWLNGAIWLCGAVPLGAMMILFAFLRRRWVFAHSELGGTFQQVDRAFSFDMRRVVCRADEIKGPVVVTQTRHTFHVKDSFGLRLMYTRNMQHAEELAKNMNRALGTKHP